MLSPFQELQKAIKEQAPLLLPYLDEVKLAIESKNHEQIDAAFEQLEELLDLHLLESISNELPTSQIT